MRGWDVLDEAYERFQPVGVYACFSGGHDSLTASHIAHAWGRERGVTVWTAHINTGIGVPATNEFVRRTCREKGWPLREVHPPVSYDELVLDEDDRYFGGFPGPGAHSFPYQRLKERCLRQLKREAKVGHHRNSKVLFASGVRKQESERRMKHVERIQEDEDGFTWAAPIWDWSKKECNAYIEERGLPRNEVVDLIHMSGECLCGAYAKKDEIKELEMWFPETAQRIHDLEAKAEALGLRRCKWGVKVTSMNRGQLALDDEHNQPGHLCQDCAPVGGAA